MEKKKYEFLVLKIIGIIMVILGILAIMNSLYLRNPNQIFWMCYISLLIIGIGILTRNSYLIMSQIYILTIPILVWDIDFIYHLLFQVPLWGLTDYFFVENSFNLGKFITLQHLYTLPLSFYAVHLIGLKKRDAWKISFVQVFLVFIFVTLFTSPEKNINCVFEPCLNIYLGLPYQLTWLIISFSIVFITSFLANKLPFIRKSLDEKKN